MNVEIDRDPSALIGGGVAWFAKQHGRNHSREFLQPFGGPKVTGKRKITECSVPISMTKQCKRIAATPRSAVSRND